MSDSTRPALPTSPAPAERRAATWADSAGVLGAVFAALCCMGAPLIVSVLAAIGLSWLRQDAILWPLMFLSLGIAFWGLWGDRRRRHGLLGPLALATVGALALVAGVVLVHGPPARLVIYAGALVLVAATLWNISACKTGRQAPIPRAVQQ
jgi:mercuric ion transport protein